MKKVLLSVFLISVVFSSFSQTVPLNLILKSDTEFLKYCKTIKSQYFRNDEKYIIKITNDSSGNKVIQLSCPKKYEKQIGFLELLGKFARKEESEFCVKIAIVGSKVNSNQNLIIIKDTFQPESEGLWTKILDEHLLIRARFELEEHELYAIVYQINVYAK